MVRAPFRRLTPKSPLKNQPALACYSVSLFSGDAAASAVSKGSVDETSFRFAKAEATFNKIIALEREHIATIGDIVAERLGISILPDLEGNDAEAVGGGGDAAKEEVKEERTAFDLRLVSFEPKSKIKVIKEVRAIAELGLKEAKEMVEGAPKIVKKNIKMENAEELKKKLEEVGAMVEIV